MPAASTDSLHVLLSEIELAADPALTMATIRLASALRAAGLALDEKISAAYEEAGRPHGSSFEGRDKWVVTLEKLMPLHEQHGEDWEKIAGELDKDKAVPMFSDTHVESGPVDKRVEVGDEPLELSANWDPAIVERLISGELARSSERKKAGAQPAKTTTAQEETDAWAEAISDVRERLRELEART